MTHKELQNIGVKPWTIRLLRETQKALPSYNEIVYKASENEFTQYDLGYMTDEDILIQYQNQEQFMNINDFIKARIKDIKSEVETAEMTGHSLNFIKNLNSYQRALDDYSTEQILNMSRQERVQALKEKYYSLFGYYPDHSDENTLISEINNAA